MSSPRINRLPEQPGGPGVTSGTSGTSGTPDVATPLDGERREAIVDLVGSEVRHV
jgi:hypothetical protein